MTATDPGTGAPKSPDGFEQYLLHEFDHVTTALHQSEDSGERRVQFFMTVFAAVFGVIGLTFRGENVALAVAVREFWLPITICLVVLFLFGLSTLMRILERNVTSDKHKCALRTIRRHFVSEGVAAKYPNAFFQPYGPLTPRSAFWLKGGWLDMIILLNAILLGAIVWVVKNRSPQEISGMVAWSAVVMVAAIAAQLAFAERRYRRAWLKLKANDP